MYVCVCVSSHSCEADCKLLVCLVYITFCNVLYRCTCNCYYYRLNDALLYCHRANTAVTGSPFQISQEDAKAEVDLVS